MGCRPGCSDHESPASTVCPPSFSYFTRPPPPEALPIGSTCGTLEARWNSQWVLARDILNGTFTDVEEWIRTKQPSDIYGEGQNAGALGLVRIKYYMDTFSGAYISEIKRMLVGGIYA